MIAVFTVPPPPMRGRQIEPDPGMDDGEQCLRAAPGLPVCLKRIEMRARDHRRGCSCHLGGAPCGHCMSIVPECPAGCWRAEEPS